MMRVYELLDELSNYDPNNEVRISLDGASLELVDIDATLTGPLLVA